LSQESPTLDLTNDCFRFVIGFFDAISLSAPHIYHSALLLSPKTSIVQKLYGPQVDPLARVVHGAPTSWDQSIATKRFLAEPKDAVWSPCSKHIGIIWGDNEVAVLDAATLEQLYTLYIEDKPRWHRLIFSPDGHLLVACSYDGEIFSWDLQTGGLVSKIRGDESFKSMSFSECGTMLGGFFSPYGREGRQGIVICDIIPGTQTSSHSLPGLVVITIWTHGECLQFATIGFESIIIWEVGFTSTNAPAQVASLNVPFTFNPSGGVAFLPTLFQLSFIHQGRIVVWDALHQKILLDSTDVKDPGYVSFSTGGHFFICRTTACECHFWKESPDGYLPHQNLLFSKHGTEVVVSPNGEAIISLDDSQLQLWHINPHTYTPTILPQHPQDIKSFLIEFSPDGSLVAIAEQLGDMVTILDIKSGNPQLVIDTDMGICGIRITESRVNVVGVRKAVAWELPTGNCVPNAQGNIDNSVQITTFKLPYNIQPYASASISPDLNHAAFVDPYNLYICSMDTGEQLVDVRTCGQMLGFTSDGTRVWCAGFYYRSTELFVNQWEIFRDDESGIFELKQAGSGIPLRSLPWHSSCGYQVTDNGWVLSPGGKLLLWLPHQWRSVRFERKWSGNFLAIFHMGLPEPVILELLEV